MNENFQSSFRLQRIEVKNYRCFRRCSLEVSPDLTVLVAENAQGKTALLDAAKLTLEAFVATVGRASTTAGIRRPDVHVQREDGSAIPHTPASVFAHALVDDRPIRWGREVKTWSQQVRNSRRDLRPLEDAARSMQAVASQSADQFAPNTRVLPMVGYYGTSRLWEDRRLTPSRRWIATRTPARMSAYLDCLASNSSFQAFSTWYGETMRALRDPASKANREIRYEGLLSAVRHAVKVVLQPTGWAEIDWEFSSDIQGGFMVVENPNHGRFPVSQLSDGVRNMIALVGDVAHRCARVNPHLGEFAARETPGILLIDEVDLHLHPRWQQRVVTLLREAFPRFQLILTTHSPHVLSTVDATSIRIIDSNDAEQPVKSAPVQTQGSASAEVLAKVMDVDPVPEVEQAGWLREYRSLVQNFQHDTPPAIGLWEKIVLHFGRDHPAIMEIEMLRRLADFKQQPRG